MHVHENMCLRNMKNNSTGRSSFNRKKKVTLFSNPYFKIKVMVRFKFAHKHFLMFSSLWRVSIHALGFSLPFCSSSHFRGWFSCLVVTESTCYTTGQENEKWNVGARNSEVFCFVLFFKTPDCKDDRRMSWKTILLNYEC